MACYQPLQEGRGSHDDVGHEDQGEEQDLAVWIEETAANYQDPLAPSCRG